jgi:hypothetical protein
VFVRFRYIALLSLFGLLFETAVLDRLIQAATWTFGSDMNGLTDVSSKAFAPVDAFEMTLSVHNPAGARFFEGGANGVTVNSTGLSGITDVEGADKINLLMVGGVPAATAEAVEFSFDKPGVLTGIDFDGVKDEALEYFVLTSSAGVRINFFDSFANTSIPGAVDDAIASGAVTGDVVYLLETGVLDDEAQGLRIPFAAGQQFVVTYAELAAVAHPAYEPGNGARLQGITVESVPEPGAILMTITAATLTYGLARPTRVSPALRLRTGQHPEKSV